MGPSSGHVFRVFIIELPLHFGPFHLKVQAMNQECIVECCVDTRLRRDLLAVGAGLAEDGAPFQIVHVLMLEIPLGDVIEPGVQPGLVMLCACDLHGKRRERLSVAVEALQLVRLDS